MRCLPNKTAFRIAVCFAMNCLPWVAYGQFPPDQGAPPDWAFECIDPKNVNPISNPYFNPTIYNELMLISEGDGGTVAYGGSNTLTSTPPYISPCFWPPVPGPQTSNNQGMFSMAYGAYGPLNLGTGKIGVGSIQRYSPFFNTASLAL